MKFKITCTANWVSDEDYKKLSKLGIYFREETNEDYKQYGTWYREDYHEKSGFIEINTLEELLAIEKKYGKLIVSDNEIEIYNDYRE